MKVIADFKVEANIPLGEAFHRIFLKTESPLPDIHPGQFVQVCIASSVHGWLRIPVSVHNACAAEGRVALLVQKVGDGSRKICSLQEGSTVNLVLPLGKGFTIEPLPQKALLVGGGAGLAPLYYLAECLRARLADFDVLMGARDAAHLVLRDEFAALAQTFICTEDGSDGEKGLVTEHPLWGAAADGKMLYTHIYTCGPTPMMRAVAAKARELGARCELSLENTMACGLGACLCCVTPDAAGHNVCVCTAGPVFDAEEVL